MTKKEIKLVSKTISNALLSPLLNVRQDEKYAWGIAYAVLKGLKKFIPDISKVYFTSIKVNSAKLNFEALFELSKKDQLNLFYNDLIHLANDLNKSLPVAVEESINQGLISFTEINPDNDNSLQKNVLG